MIATWLLTLGCGLIASRFHHDVGIAPVLGAILCAGIFLKPRDLWIIGLGGMLIRDLILGFSLFTLVRLAAIALVILSIRQLKLQPNLRSLLTGLVISSPLFHLTLAVGDWVTGTCGHWPRTPQGLAQSIASSWPYFQKSLAVDLLFSALFLLLYTAVVVGLVNRKVGSAVR